MDLLTATAELKILEAAHQTALDAMNQADQDLNSVMAGMSNLDLPTAIANRQNARTAYQVAYRAMSRGQLVLEQQQALADGDTSRAASLQMVLDEDTRTGV